MVTRVGRDQKIEWPTRLRLIGRAATEQQIGRHFFAHATKPGLAARQAIGRAKKNGLVTSHWTVQHPVLQAIGKPIVDWEPESPTPDFEHVSWKLRSRWSKKPVRTRVVFPAEKRPARKSEWLHDCHVVELFFALGAPRSWVHEDELSGFRDLPFRPDAIVCEKNKTICLDFGGRYKAAKLAAMHRSYQAENISYRLY